MTEKITKEVTTIRNVYLSVEDIEQLIYSKLCIDGNMQFDISWDFGQIVKGCEVTITSKEITDVG